MHRLRRQRPRHARGNDSGQHSARRRSRQTHPFAGKGEAGFRGGPAGDLFITPRIRPHPILNRSGRDLSMDLPITVGEAVRGASVEVPTPSGAIMVKIPLGAQSGQQLRIKGKGVPGPRANSRWRFISASDGARAEGRYCPRSDRQNRPSLRRKRASKHSAVTEE